MKRCLLMLGLVIGMLGNSVFAAPIGWYELNAAWRDGNFEGKFFYDSSAATPIIQIEGLLTDIAQTTAITTVWTGGVEPPQTGIFVSNTPGADGMHDAGFYLNLLDLDATLSLDLSADNGLYDFSQDYAYYTPEQLAGSPLLAFTITAVQDVPEPGVLSLMAIGACALVRRRRSS